tara:strand:- start:1799 stop:3247 length:1449 start_codon:yes stop_codon:yes gene_type:complete
MSLSDHLKITVLGHACMLVEASDVRLLVDPWLVGSCYWRSWWNYPEIDKNFVNQIRPSHIYLSHLHWDHYHGPTLRKFYDSDPIIILPKAATERMKSDMKRDFRFSRIVEVMHGKECHLGYDFSITSFQFNPFIIDSALAIKSCGIKILNANDSKVFGLSLKQIVSRFQSFDFVFRSHSSATPDPYCVEGVDPYASSRKPDDYTKDFVAFAKACNAKYVVPFASSHVYLHKGSEQYNEYYNNPSFVRDNYSRYNTESECILMPPLSSWSNQDGFDICNHDYTQIKSHICQMRAAHAESLQKEYRKIEKARVDRSALENYFCQYLRSLPWFLPRLRFGFFLTSKLDDKSAIGELVIVDSKKSCISFGGEYEYEALVSGDEFRLSFILKTYSHVINDCARKKMFNTFTPSKLLRIYSYGRGLSYGAFFSLIDAYENDCLPLTRVFTPRQFENRISRWREFLDVFYLLYIIKFRKFQLFRLWSEL